MPELVSSPSHAQAHRYFGKIIDNGFARVDDLSPEKMLCSPGSMMVCPVPPDHETAGGIVLPESSRRPPNIGVIVSLNPQEIVYELGGIVMFHDQSGMEICIRGQEFRIIQYCEGVESDIIAYWPPEQEPEDGIS